MARRTHCFCGCGRPLPEGHRKWFSNGHRNNHAQKLKRAEQRELDARIKADAVKGHANEDGRDHGARGGALYEAFVTTGLLDSYRRGDIDQHAIAEELGVNQSTVSRWVGQAAKDKRLAELDAEWEVPEKYAHMLEDTTEAFEAFYTTMFPVDRRGKPTIVKDFHLEWIEMLLDAYTNGRQNAILAPQRHGKTQLLVAYCCWLIVKNPNVSILWVAATADMAKKAVNNVRVTLETNENLRELLPPGKAFRPANSRSGSETSMPWTSEEFTVATRTIWHKSPTMVAVGAGGTLLSRDADQIVADDIVDHKKVHQAGMREKVIDWWATDLTSRIEEHTGATYIGSRQHPEDLTNWLDTNPEWDVRTWSAHDPSCAGSWDASEDDTEPAFPEQHTDCMLFPEVRTFKWLWSKRRSMKSQKSFDLAYQNLLVASDEAVFDREAMEGCYDKLRNMGWVPPGYRLIAGFDPGGGSGFQAAVLWAVRPSDGHRVLVDIENRKGGGIAHMRDLIDRWSNLYPGLGTWVFEMNILKDTLEADHEIRTLQSRYNLTFLPHKTNANKWDRRIGVWAMEPMYADGRVVIPYGDQQTRDKAREFVNQHARFEPEQATGRHAVFDLVMAAWFPQLTIQRWLTQAGRETERKESRPRTPYPKGRRVLRSSQRGQEVVGVMLP